MVSSAEAAGERLAAAAVAAGERPADLVLRGGRVVDVHLGRVLPADVAVAGRRIAAVGDVRRCVDSSTEVVDCRGLYLLPGLIDAHIHVGGSQLVPERLAEVLVPRGTAAICTDFYEPGFIAGLEAVEELVERAEGTGLEVLLSPFHASALGLGPFGDLGRFSLDDLARLLRHPKCVEIREWNHAVATIPLDGMRRVYETALETGVVIGGHMEGLRGPEVEASAAIGALSDHEVTGVEEALEKLRAGVMVQVREGSGARDLAQVVRAITEHGADPARFGVCSDEQELAAIARDGHMDHKLRLLVGEGVAPLDAVRMATVNTARYLKLEAELGSIAPGRLASVTAVEDLAGFRVRLTVSHGRLSSEDGTYRLKAGEPSYPERWRQTVKVAGPLAAADFRLDLEPGAAVRVIGVTPGSLVTSELVERVELRDGRLTGDSGDGDGGLAKIAVLDRHEGARRRAVGLIRGLGIRRGAFAATVNPGMMNLLVVGVSDEDMAVAASRVAELGGGIAVARDGSVRAEVALPLFGILSDAPAAEVVARCTEVEAALAEELGSPLEGLLTTAGFACLAVSIPSLKLCDRGLVRVSRNGQEPVALVAAEQGG